MLSGSKGTKEYDQIMTKLKEINYKHQEEKEPQSPEKSPEVKKQALIVK